MFFSELLQLSCWNFSAFEESAYAVVDNEQGKNDQGNGNDALETMHHEDEGTVSHGCEDLEKSHRKCSHRDHEHDRHRDVEHPTLTPRALKEHCQSSENERREELIGGAKERPNAHIASLAECETAEKGDDCCNDRVAKEGGNRTLLLTFSGRTEFLQAHATDTSHGVNRGERKRGHTHRENTGRDVSWKAKDVGQEACDRGREELEWGTRWELTIGRGSADHHEGNHTEHTFNEHGTVTHETHVAFVSDHLRRRARGHKAMEARDCTASNRHKEDREEVEVIDRKSRKGWHIDGRIFNEHTHHARSDHTDQKEHREVVTGLLQEPHWHHRGSKKVSKDHPAPRVTRCIHWEGDTQGYHREHEYNTYTELNLRVGLHVLDVKTEEHSTYHVDHGDGGGSGVRCGKRTSFGEAIKSGSHHVSKRRDHKHREEPAERQEELAPNATDVLFNKHTHGLATVFNGRIKRSEVLNGTEENAANNNPKQRG